MQGDPLNGENTGRIVLEREHILDPLVGAKMVIPDGMDRVAIRM